MAKFLKQKSFRDFSRGTWHDIQSSVAPENSSKFSLNLDSDVELASLVQRKGTAVIGNQLSAGNEVLSVHNYRDSFAVNNKLFAVVDAGGNNTIYDVEAGTESLTGDTRGLKTYFLSYLNSCLRLNGTDPAKEWNGSSWIDTAGSFDLANFPTGAKYAVEFKDRVYVAGGITTPDRVDISGIADSVSKTISWTVDNKFFMVEQEDGGGGITGLSKVPGYVLIFKKRSMKRYDGSSAYPEDMMNQGAPSQDAIVVAKGICFFVNENGAWATEGGMAKKISTYTVDKIIKSCSSNDLLNVAAGTDEEHIFFSFPEVTVDGEVYTNFVLKYNINQQAWDTRQYANANNCYCRYVDEYGALYTVFGDDDGNVQMLDVGTTDNGVGITYSMETQDWTFGQRMALKGINRMAVLTEGVSNGILMWRNSHVEGSWKEVGPVEKEIQDFQNIDLRGNYFNFKITETTDSGQAKILGYEFPDASIKVYYNSEI